MGLFASSLRAGLCAALTCLALGCKDGQAFEPLGSLCADLADDLCHVRNAGCCTVPVDMKSCVDSEKARCDAALAALDGEVGYRYDAEAAADHLGDVRSQLDLCQPAPPLVSFFSGGLANGSPCERASQCQGGACGGQPAVCGDAAPSALCPAVTP